METHDDDRVKVIASDLIKEEFASFMYRTCNPRHEDVHEEVKELKEDIKKLNKCITDKFNKLYLLLIVTLFSTLTAVVVSAFK